MQVLFDSFALGFIILQELVQDLLLQISLKATTPLEDVRKCCVQCIQCIDIKKEKIKLYFLYHFLYNLILWHFVSVMSLE